MALNGLALSLGALSIDLEDFKNLNIDDIDGLSYSHRFTPINFLEIYRERPGKMRPYTNMNNDDLRAWSDQIDLEGLGAWYNPMSWFKTDFKEMPIYQDVKLVPVSFQGKKKFAFAVTPDKANYFKSLKFDLAPEQTFKTLVNFKSYDYGNVYFEHPELKKLNNPSKQYTEWLDENKIKFPILVTYRSPKIYRDAGIPTLSYDVSDLAKFGSEFSYKAVQQDVIDRSGKALKSGAGFIGGVWKYKGYIIAGVGILVLVYVYNSIKK